MQSNTPEPRPGEGSREAPSTEPPVEELDEGPYGLRGRHTPPLANLAGAYAIIFLGVVFIPLILFLLVRFVIL